MMHSFKWSQFKNFSARKVNIIIFCSLFSGKPEGDSYNRIGTLGLLYMVVADWPKIPSTVLKISFFALYPRKSNNQAD